MTAPAPQQAFLAAMRAPLALAGVVIGIERALPRELGTLLTLWTLWIASALLGLTAALPGTLRVALLALLIVVSTALLLRAAWRIGVPTLAARRARLERGGGLRRGALAIGIDTPAGDPDGFGAALWARALADAQALRPRLGRLEWQPSLETRYALLPLLATALLLGLLMAKAEAPARLAAAFSPWPTTLEGVRVAVTIEPPAYVGAPPRRFDIQGGGHAALDALAGSRIAVRAEGLAGDWHVEGPKQALIPAGGRASFTLARAGDYTVMQGGRTIASLDLSLAADLPPSIRFDGDPAVTPTGALRLGYKLRDDHGASALSLRLRRGRTERTVDLETSAASGRGSVFADLTPHPFAGSTVELRIVATDGAGQQGVSPPIRLDLPQRRFANPLAREIVAVRAKLLAGAQRGPVVRRLAALAVAPEDYADNLGVFAGLRAAAWRLVHDPRRAARESTAALLWDIATDLEDGGATQAMDEMRRAMEELARGLGQGDDRALAAMADRLEAAMSDYLGSQIAAALAEGGAPQSSGAGAGATVDLGFLDQMFADLRDRLAAGDKAGAAEALANLRQLMETIRFGNAAPDPEARKRAEAAAAAAKALRDIEARQGALRDATIADMIEASFGNDAGLREGAAAQQAIRGDTEALTKQFGAAGLPAPQALQGAASAMREAGQALGAGDAGGAIRAQTRALELLRQAGNAAEAAAQRLAQAAGPGAMQPGAAGSGLDPLGRPGTGFGQGAVKLPDQAEVRRIQAIRKILEERASDPSRSPEERGYYLRLLKRF